MKKIALFTFCLISTFASNAQISKGSYLVGTGLFSGGVSGSKYTTEYSNTPTVYNSNSKNFSFGINPNVGYFVSDGFAVGGQVYLSYYSSTSDSSNSSSTTTSTNDYKSPSISIGPMLRYYFVKNQKWAPYGQADFAYNFYPSKSESTSTSGSSSTTDTKSKSNWNAGVRFGLEYFLSNYVGLQIYTGVSFSNSVYEADYTPSSGTGYSYTSTNKGWSVPLGVGLQIHLPSKSAKN